mmetsp:Transcript_723/g.2377  ORF Transcript_723/g.2377 Transcript_723/m.2377 type:complete len:128 (-) Transcript_723:69-452(-)
MAERMSSASAARAKFEGIPVEEPKPQRAKANLDGTYRKEISEEALEAVRRRKEKEAADKKAKAGGPTGGAVSKPARWIPRINGSDSDEVLQLKKRIQKKEEEIQDVLRRLDEFDQKLSRMTEQIVPL